MGKSMGSNSESNLVVQACLQLFQLFWGADAVLGCVEQKSPAKIRVFSYRDDFEVLWNMLDKNSRQNTFEKLSHASEPLTIVVVWDGMPRSEETTMNVGQYVTPFDWAVALSLCLYQEFEGRSKSSKKPNLRILILDVGSHGHEHSFGALTFQALRGVFPWVEVYHAVGRKGSDAEQVALASDHREDLAYARQAMKPGSFGIHDLVWDMIGQFESVLATWDDRDEQRNRLDEIGVCASLWKSNLMRPGDRHTIANLIGPVLLARSLPAIFSEKAMKLIAGGSGPRMALNTLIEAIGLGRALAPSSIVDPKGLVTRNAGILGRRANLNFLLVDDQFTLGYHHILGYLIFGSGYVPEQARSDATGWEFKLDGLGVLRCTAATESLLNLLEAFGPITDWTAPRMLNANCDVLLLDLRLWPAEPSGEARRRLMKRLVGVCEKLSFHSLEDPQVMSSLACARRIANGDDCSEIEALVLLPLLLSHFDPSLPIVLFSSSQQRAVLEMVSTRPNIVTTFSKPMLGDDAGTHDASTFAGNLYQAITRAIELHEIRIIWELITRVDGWKKLPVFVETDPRTKQPAVYNWQMQEPPPAIPVGQVRKSLPIVPEECSPRLTGAALKRVLGGHYQEYLLLDRYLDYMPVPWELLEYWIPPKQILVDPEARSRLRFHSELDKSNCLADLLWIVRNKKAHGKVSRPNNEVLRRDADLWRGATIILFMVLLDFIQGGSSKGALLHSREVREFRNYLASRYTQLPRWVLLWQLQDFGPIYWPEFLIFAAMHAVDASREQEKLQFSAPTVKAIRALAKAVIERVGRKPVQWDGDIVGENLGIVPANDADAMEIAESTSNEDIKQMIVTRLVPRGFRVGYLPDHDLAFCLCTEEQRPSMGATIAVRIDYANTEFEKSDGYAYAVVVK
jgi:hypothetical protein